jgi:hypothetical protein
MRHPIWYRLLVTLWGIWFSTALIEPAGFFACAMHSGSALAGMVGVSVSGAVQSPTADMSHHAHATPDRVETSAPEHDGHPCCTCLGQCCTMTAAVVAQADVTVELLLSQQAADSAVVVLSRIPLRPAHALPFANGPPTIAHA